MTSSSCAAGLRPRAQAAPPGLLAPPGGRAPLPLPPPALARAVPTRAAAGEPRPHGTKNRFCHGPDEHDVPGKGCRCVLCTAASHRADKQRALAIEQGRWRPFVPAGPAREHMKKLAAYGIGYRQVSVVSGLAISSLTKLLYGGPGDRPPSRRIRPETEAAILAVRAVPANLAESALVDVTGTRRRLQALVAVGWPQRRLADRLGVTWQEVYRLMTRSERVKASTVRAVVKLYAELWNRQPPQDTRAQRAAVRGALRIAERRRWRLPAEWDDDVIDDPQATAEDCRRRARKLRQADLVEEARELIDEQGYTVEHAAGRLGVSRDALDQAFARTARDEHLTGDRDAQKAA